MTLHFSAETEDCSETDQNKAIQIFFYITTSKKPQSFPTLCNL